MGGAELMWWVASAKRLTPCSVRAPPLSVWTPPDRLRNTFRWTLHPHKILLMPLYSEIIPWTVLPEVDSFVWSLGDAAWAASAMGPCYPTTHANASLLVPQTLSEAQSIGCIRVSYIFLLKPCRRRHRRGPIHSEIGKGPRKLVP